MSIVVKHATKDIGPDCVLDDVSLDIPRGCVTGLAGINGSGKTMLMRAACGLIRLTAGEIIVDGKRLGVDAEFPPSIGLCIEGPAFLDFKSGFDNLRLLARIKGIASEADIRTSLERVGLDPSLSKRYHGYSLGMKQRLGIAAAIMERPDVLVLDEPTNALDASGVEMLKRVVCEERDRGATVLVSCHDAAVLQNLADKIYRMQAGKIVGEV